MTFFIKQNDTSPAMLATLQDASGQPVDLTGSTIRFYMGNINGNVVNAPAILVNPQQGRVRYNWLPQDTSNSGMYQAEFEVVYADATKETFPNSSYILVTIKPDLED